MSAQLALPLAITEIPDPATPDSSAKPYIVQPAQPRSKNSRHARRCTVCHHADRPEIEDDFLHWRPATEIAAEYTLPDRRAVYRHARATGLYRKRMRNMRVACSYIAEHADRVTPNGKNVLDAIRACSLIDDDGVWHEPTRRVIVEHINAPQSSPDSVAANSDQPPATPPETKISNVYSVQSESAATPTKQKPAHRSNVYSAAISQDMPSFDTLPGLDEGLLATSKPKRDPSTRERVSG